MDDHVAYYRRKLMADLADALVAVAVEDWDLARRVLENRAAPAAAQLYALFPDAG